MTANELADKLDLVRIELTIQASAMIRQQQAEIEALRNHRAWIKETAVKDLTDEEISEEAKKWGMMGLFSERQFARAILQKASEK
jgi:hypothetical protein